MTAYLLVWMSLKYYNSNNSTRGGVILPSADVLHVSSSNACMNRCDALLNSSALASVNFWLKKEEKRHVSMYLRIKWFLVNDSQVYIVPKTLSNSFFRSIRFPGTSTQRLLTLTKCPKEPVLGLDTIKYRPQTVIPTSQVQVILLGCGASCCNWYTGRRQKLHSD